MNKQAITTDVWAIQLIHEHGRVTNQIKNLPYGDTPHITTDEIEDLEDRLNTIEMILVDHHGIDLLRDLKQ